MNTQVPGIHCGVRALRARMVLRAQRWASATALCGMGVVCDQPVEKLYREIRALRIYEGATEVQQLIIARELLKSVQA